jgi:hypothetical protein
MKLSYFRSTLLLFIGSLALATPSIAQNSVPLTIEARTPAQERNPSQLRDPILSEAESKKLTDGLPKGIQQLLHDEIHKNLFFVQEATSEEFLKLELFHPKSERWFYLPHLEIPVSDLDKMNIADSISDDLSEVLFFKKGNKEYVRYFLHPFREMKNYEEAIKKYPLKYEYFARPTSSPRSLIVVSEKNPSKPYWIKVSLHVKLTMLQRRQKVEKLARALIVNEALDMIPSATKEKLKFTHMAEPVAIKMPGKEEVIIGREIADPWKKGARSTDTLRSTFALFFSEGQEAEVTQMIRKSGLSEMEFFEKHMIRPVMNVFSYLGFEEGIQAGLHSANYYTYIGKNGLPTGKIVIKDLDGSWFDAETRMLRKKPFGRMHEFTSNPFADMLFPSATGRGSSDRQHFGEIYNRYIRNANGFSSLSWLIDGYMEKKHPKMDPVKRQKMIQDTFDKVAIEHIKSYSGLDFALADMKSGHLKGNGLNKALNHNRDEMLMALKREDAIPEHQSILKQAFEDLKKTNRVWTATSLSEADLARRLSNPNITFFYDERSGMIQVRSYSGKDSENFRIFGYGFIDDPQKPETKKFLQSIKKASPSSNKCSRALKDIVTSINGSSYYLSSERLVLAA